MEARANQGRGDDPEAACERAWAGIRAFVAGDLDRVGDAELREHLERCGSCRDAYRGAVMTTARIGRERRRERVERERAERRGRLRRLAFEPAARGPGAPGRVRTLVYPAVLVLMLFVAARVPSRPELVCLAGEARAGAVALDRSGARAELERGTLCAVLPGGSARLGAPDAELLLEGGTALRVERSRPLRVRLLRGSVALSGACEVSTELGVLANGPGGASVRLDDAGLALEADAAGATFTGPDGSRELVPGQRLSLPPD